MFMYQIYPIILLIHILSAIIWLGFFPVEISLIKSIKKETNEDFKKLLVQKLLNLTNLTGMIGSIGIILTGILLVVISPVYNFFEVKANHWLTTKQFIILIILLITFLFIIPVSKKIKNSSADNSLNFQKFVRWAYTEKILVLINFLLAFLHRFYF
ncbi:MAG: hypothetical protein N3F03_04015 [Ignavibacteria bacterium]|nr:hypothetical protein [Ignavibacteria bacterium]